MNDTDEAPSEPLRVPLSDQLGPLVERLRAFVALDGGDIADVEAAADTLDACRAVGIQQEQMLMNQEREIARLKAHAVVLANTERQVERERWIEAVMAELDGNGQAHAIVAYATRA